MFVKKPKRNARVAYRLDGLFSEVEGLISGIIFLVAKKGVYIRGLITGRGLTVGGGGAYNWGL